MYLKTCLVAFAASVAVLGAGIGLQPVETAYAAAAVTARLNPNTATEAQLRAISVVNDAVVAKIQQGKPFATVSDFSKAIAGTLTPDQTKALYEQLFVPIELNTASREDIMLIPGMTARMVREFLEYRPYRSMDQFNREIGKYVDQTELARLASYVTLK